MTQKVQKLRYEYFAMCAQVAMFVGRPKHGAVLIKQVLLLIPMCFYGFFRA
jgi:hypothetical protein